MKKLTQVQANEKAGLVGKLNDMWEDIETVLGHVNEQINELNKMIGDYNETLSEAETWKDEIVGKMDDYMSERSEKWGDSDAGQAYNDWQGEWNSYDATPMEEIDEINLDQPDHADNLDQLPGDPE